MAEPEYKELYRFRPSIAEFPNADCRHRNLRQFRVRGLLKVKAAALWHALAFNLLRMASPGALVIQEAEKLLMKADGSSFRQCNHRRHRLTGAIHSLEQH